MTESTNAIEALSETSRKNGSFNFLLGLIAFMIVSMVASIGYIIHQNSNALNQIPKEISSLNITISNMNSRIEKVERQGEKIYEIDKKIDLYIFQKYRIGDEKIN
ncbi:MAG: hypothetical protein ACRCX2_27485 [Paraclostridium sp.]